MYKYSEVADILGVTRSTVYNRVSKLKKELTGHIKTRKKVKYITEEGLSILRQYNDTVKNNSETNGNKDNSRDIEHLNELIELKNEQIDYLKEQYNMQTELLKNSQVLLKQQQDRVLMLEHKLEDEEEEPAPNIAQAHETNVTLWSRITNAFKSS